MMIIDHLLNQQFFFVTYFAQGQLLQNSLSSMPLEDSYQILVALERKRREGRVGVR